MPVGRSERVKPVESLKEFFKDSLAGAMDRQCLSADDHTAHYVVNLLTLFARSEAFFDCSDGRVELRPLASVLADSMESAEPGRRNHALQRIGDVSLFVAGVLGDGLARRTVDLDYYVYMGGSAYAALSESSTKTSRGSVYSSVFAELAAKFQDFVDVLAEVVSRAGPSDIDVLRSYDVWLRTGSKREARRLRSIGIEPNHNLDFAPKH